MDHSSIRAARRHPGRFGRLLPPVAGIVLLGALVTAPTVAWNLERPEPVLENSYTLRNATLASGATTTARWNPCQEAITWQANLTGWPKKERRAMLEQITVGVAKVAAATGMIYRYTGSTTFVPRQENLVSAPADIVVAVINPKTTNFSFTENSLGYGGVLWATWYGGDGEGAAVVRGYAVLIPDGLRKLRPGYGKGNRQGNVILHELGHSAGLDHAGSSRQQMYPNLTAKSPSGLAAGDRTGLGKVGTEAGCIAVPSRVNITDYS